MPNRVPDMHPRLIKKQPLIHPNTTSLGLLVTYFRHFHYLFVTAVTYLLFSLLFINIVTFPSHPLSHTHNRFPQIVWRCDGNFHLPHTFLYFVMKLDFFKIMLYIVYIFFVYIMKSHELSSNVLKEITNMRRGNSWIAHAGMEILTGKRARSNVPVQK